METQIDRNVVITDIADEKILGKVRDSLKIIIDTPLKNIISTKCLKDSKLGIVIRPDESFYFSSSNYYENFSEDNFLAIHFMDVLEFGIDTAISRAMKDNSTEENEVKPRGKEKVNMLRTEEDEKRPQVESVLTTNKPEKQTLIELIREISEEKSEKTLKVYTIAKLQTLLGNLLENQKEIKSKEGVEKKRILQELEDLGALVIGLDYSGMDVEQLERILKTAKGK